MILKTIVFTIIVVVLATSPNCSGLSSGEQQFLTDMIQAFPDLASLSPPWQLSNPSSACNAPTWYGLTCFNDSITGLSLINQNLTGTIPFSIDNLYNIDLSWNQISGTIPTGLGNFLKMTSLNLGHNQFSGTIQSSIANALNLTQLDLSYNNLIGSIPDLFSRLNNLQNFILSSNQLSDEITRTLAYQMPLLSVFDIDSNQFYGTLDIITTFPSLYQFHAQSNYFYGTIPTNVSNFIELSDFNIANNAITGSIPDQLFHLYTMEYLNLSSNRLTGNVSTNISGLYNLKSLDMSRNQLTGSFPSELSSVAGLKTMFIQYNSFEMCGVVVNHGLTQCDISFQLISDCNNTCSAQFEATPCWLDQVPLCFLPPVTPPSLPPSSCPAANLPSYFVCINGMWKAYQDLDLLGLTVPDAPIQVYGNLMVSNQLSFGGIYSHLAVNGCVSFPDLATLQLTQDALSVWTSSHSNSAPLELATSLGPTYCPGYSFTDLNTVTVQVAMSKSTCTKVSTTPSGTLTSLVPKILVNNSPCNIWWIVVISVGSVGIIVCAVVLVILMRRKMARKAEPDYM